MPYINDFVYDAALSVFSNDADRIDVTSTEAATYAEASNTYSLGFKTGITVGSPGDRTPNGRKVTVASVNDGEITANGTVGFWALSDVANTRLLAAGELSSTQAVTDGNSFALTSFDIGIPDAT